MTTGGFQSQVGTLPARGVAGDFASGNPRYLVDAGPGGLVAGPSGVIIGRFCWASYLGIDGDGAPAYVNNTGGGPVTGLVGRGEQALNTTYLSNAGMTIPAGFPVEVFSGVDMWVVNDGSVTAVPGMKAYADFATGKASFAATGNASTATQTSATIVAGTAATFTGSISGNVLTISSAVVNTLYYGALLGGTGLTGLNTGVHIVGLLSGTKGVAGSTYALDGSELTIASEAMTATPYTAAGTGGVGVVVGSTITATSAGSSGTVIGAVVFDVITTSTSVVVAMPGAGTGTNTSATLTFEQNVETSWYCRSQGLATELVKISNIPGIG